MDGQSCPASGTDALGALERFLDGAAKEGLGLCEVERESERRGPTETFTPAQSRPFFEALLPEGAVREQIATMLRLAASDSYGLLAELGRDCAGALQIIEHKRLSDVPSVRWLEPEELDRLIHELPQRPLGIAPGDQRLRLSLAGVQRKAVLVRDEDGRIGEPLNGMPSTHILKPQPADGGYPDIACNEFFCMRLAERCGLSAAKVELISADGRPCLAVERFDRNTTSSPVLRLHQEDLCQALGLTPDFKYERRERTLPSYGALAELLDDHSLRPGADRLAAAQRRCSTFWSRTPTRTPRTSRCCTSLAESGSRRCTTSCAPARTRTSAPSSR